MGQKHVTTMSGNYPLKLDGKIVVCKLVEAIVHFFKNFSRELSWCCETQLTFFFLVIFVFHLSRFYISTYKIQIPTRLNQVESA